MYFLSRRKKRRNQVQKKISMADSNSIKLVPSNFQHVGARETQEDAFAFSDMENLELSNTKGVLAVVADGMGGLSFGEEASRVAVQTFLKEFTRNNSLESVSHCLSRALIIANASVFDLAYQDGQELDIGTTLTAAVIFKNALYWISVGDSRIYLYRNGKLTRLSRDHIYLNHLIEDVNNGKITMSQAKNNPEGRYLTSHLGLLEIPEVDQSNDPLLLIPGDLVLLCSDGLYNTLSNQEITELLDCLEENSKENIAENLVRKVLSKNKRHQDNITVVVLSCQSEDSRY